MLRGTSSNDIVYDPKFSAQSHAHNLGAVRRFGDLVGRLPLDKAGTRAAAQGTFPSHWRPSAPPNDSITRPGSASCGVAFQRQITRKQDVNGKLLENIAMTRFLFGTSGTGPENYDGAWDSMMKPLKVSHLKKIGPGQHLFGKQTGRLPLNRVGTRAAADGVFPSHWEPGMGYSETMNNEGKSVANFSKQPGRIELHLSGMRGAPPKASLAADYQGPETSARPQSAMGRCAATRARRRVRRSGRRWTRRCTGRRPRGRGRTSSATRSRSSSRASSGRAAPSVRWCVCV